MIQLKVKLVEEGARAPKRSTDGAAGFDLFCWLIGEEFWPAEGTVHVVGTGVALAIPEGHVGLILGRSSSHRRGIHVHPGVIDSDYRGQVGIQFTVERPSPISHGDRIAQLLLVPVAMCDVLDVEELEKTVRGKGGFGSSGR